MVGVSYLPLHYGKCPAWLFRRMRKLSFLILKAILEEKGSKKLLELFSDPYWFQSFGNYLGFDWHSSGLTTTVLAASKEINNGDFGFYIAGGKGRRGFLTPEEIKTYIGENKTSEKLITVSKVVTKIDNILLQDSYDLYLHFMLFDEKGRWVVIQQGKNQRYARRYHWDYNTEFISSSSKDPRKGIFAENLESFVLNLSSKDSKEARNAILELLTDKKALFMSRKKNWKELEKLLEQELEVSGFLELFMKKGIGKKTIRSLYLLAKLLYGVEADWKDPAKYSFAHGGKDGVPYSINLNRYDKEIELIKDLLSQKTLRSFVGVN